MLWKNVCDDADDDNENENANVWLFWNGRMWNCCVWMKIRLISIVIVYDGFIWAMVFSVCGIR